ncbi:spectrin beta chain, brain [Parasponia andersonii]|uniref:Spectrin beta chain, brain n=1 Tax=Parasponia andersonii TaxID=3476 RepID=A0A2P5AY02_PARAD|nr:spectrin beta chain, brain [Parasponia andersonii]
MLSSGNNLSRNTAAPSNVPPLPQCLPLEPITLGNQKYPRPGELRRALGVPSTSENHSFGVSHPKAPAPVGKDEIKHLKESVQDASKKARDRARMLHESMFKLDKYREALTTKKWQRSDLLSSERSSGVNLIKAGSQINRIPHDTMTLRLGERAKNAVLNKRIRTSVADQRAESRSSVTSRQQMFTDKDGNTFQPVSGSSGRIEEKTRRLLAGGEGLDQKIKKKRSVGAVGSRVINGDRDVKRPTHPKLAADTKLRSCDAHSFRLKSSTRVGGINKLDNSFEPTNSDSCTVHKIEPETATLSRDQMAVLEQSILVKGSNKPNMQQNNSIGSPNPVTKGKVSKVQRIGSVMALDSSPSARPSGAFQGSEQPTVLDKVAVSGIIVNQKRQVSAGSPIHPMTQWVGQRPHKHSRARRTNLLSPVSNHVETQISLQGIATSEFSARTSSVGTTGSVLVSDVDNASPKFKGETENATSLYGLSESEESGAGENMLKERKINNGEASLTTSHKVGAFVLPTKKNKLLANESGYGLQRQGRSGRGSSLARPAIPPAKEKSKNIPATEPLQDVVPSDKNRSKIGRPPSKKLKERKGLTHLRPMPSNGSSDFTGESDDYHEELYLAAKSARNASSMPLDYMYIVIIQKSSVSAAYLSFLNISDICWLESVGLACSNTFWKKMEYIFASLRSEDASYLKQQLSVAEELGESLSQMFGNELNVLDAAAEGFENCSGNGLDTVCGTFDRRFDKVTPLYQRVLSALIEEDEGEDFFHQSEGKNTSLQYASDDSHCGSCNQIDIEPKDKDRIESEVESNLGFQTQKNCLLDRFSCDNSSAAINTLRNHGYSGFLHSSEQWPGDFDLIHSDVGHVSEIFLNDFGHIEPRENEIPGFPSSNCEYQSMSVNDKLLLELQSIGLYPEILPDLAEGEVIIEDIMELKEGLQKQIARKKRNLGRIEKAIQKGRDVERRKIEQIAMDKLIEMAYRKRMACRGSNASKSAVRRVSKQVASAFVKRTLGRCLKFEETGKSCFSDPALQDVLFSSPSSNNDTKSADCIGSGTASNTCNEVSYQTEVRGVGMVSCAFERHDLHGDNLDRGSSEGLQTATHFSKRASYNHLFTPNRGKKREVLIDDVVGSASSRVTSAFESAVLELKGKRSDGDNFKNNSLSGGGHSSLDSSQPERKTKAKLKQKNTQSTSGSVINGRVVESTGPSRGSSQSAINAGNRKSEQMLPRNTSKVAEEPMQFNELDPMEELGGNQDLTSWLNFEEEGLMDHDSIGLEIPMDDLSDLNMLM